MRLRPMALAGPGPITLLLLGLLGAGQSSCGGATAETPAAPVRPPASAAAPAPQASLALAQSSSMPTIPPPTPSARAVVWTPPASAAMSPEGNPLPSLPRLYGALLSLRTGGRTEPVRFMWLGDSHTQPDIWTAAVREPLQARFGDGGPGFLHVGFQKWGYRHQGVKFDVQGTWLLEPKRMLSEKPWGDGVLGLCGIRLSTEGGATSLVDVDASRLAGPSTWDLAYRPTVAGAELQIQADDGPSRQVPTDGEIPGAIRHEVWASPGPGGKLLVLGASHGVQLMGVTVEAKTPGVVFDVLGLNGARVVHALAWDEAGWESEVARRKPDLIVIAYGTNESGLKGLGMNTFARQLSMLVARAKRASPDAECLIVGAMDRGGEPMSEHIQRMNGAQEKAAREVGCAFWSAQRAMGGLGGMQRWAEEEPPAAASDHVHLNSKGYRRLGGVLARDILAMIDSGSTRQD